MDEEILVKGTFFNYLEDFDDEDTLEFLKGYVSSLDDDKIVIDNIYEKIKQDLYDLQLKFHTCKGVYQYLGNEKLKNECEVLTNMLKNLKPLIEQYQSHFQETKDANIEYIKELDEKFQNNQPLK